MPGALPPLPEEVERLARMLTSGMMRMGLHAFTPGERDLRIGAALLKKLAREYKLPVISANIADDGGKLLFPPSRMVTVAGVKVGLFGVTQAEVTDAADWTAWKLTILDPEQSARREVEALRRQGAQMVVGLLHAMNPQDASKLAEAVPGLDWAVLGHGGQMMEEPLQAGGARLLEAFAQGKHIGRLDLHVVNGKLSFTDRGKRAQLLTMHSDRQRQLDDYRRKVATEKGGATEHFKKRVSELELALTRDEAELKRLAPRITGSWFENRIIPLDSGSADHPALAMLVNGYNKESERRAAEGKIVGTKPRYANVPPPVPPVRRGPAPAGTATPQGAPAARLEYTGTFACKQCHEPAMKAWQDTKHAHALSSLQRKKRDGDPNCVGCHVTGFLRPGGTGDVSVATGRLRDVGCEACHGPGAAHVAGPKKTNIRRQVEPGVCLGCHTPDQTQGDFDHAVFVKAILGPGHGG